MGGRIAEALNELRELYDRGADPLAVMQDLLEITHFLTRVKVAPGAEGFFDGGSGEATRAAEMAAKLSVPSLTRAWQIAAQGSVRSARRDAADRGRRNGADPSCLCRRSAADRQAGARSARRRRRALRARPSHRPRRRRPRRARASLPATRSTAARCAARRSRRWSQNAPDAAHAAKTSWRWPQRDGASVLQGAVSKNDVHLVRLEPGQIEFRPGPRAPRTLAGDLAQKLKDWTGIRWVVTLAREGGAPTLAEQKARTARSQDRSRGAGAAGARGARSFSRCGDRRRARPRHRRGCAGHR